MVSALAATVAMSANMEPTQGVLLSIIITSADVNGTAEND